MRFLVLGGTHFLGRHVVATAIARGHEVTLFNRGRSDPDAFPDAEHLVGDRERDYAALRGRSWDVAVDTTGFLPRVMTLTAAALGGSVERFVFISTTAVYDHAAQNEWLDESAPLQELSDGSSENTRLEGSYGALKAASERTIEREMPARVLVVRPGPIVGPHDLTDRFTYWPRRIAEGGEVLAPAPPTRPVQVIDARDLADFVVRIAAERAVGTFNAAGRRTTLEDVIAICEAVTGGDARVVWVNDGFLVEHGVKQQTELPLWWKPGSLAKVATAINSDRAQRHGLRRRPLEETVRDTFEWDRVRPRPLPRGRVGTRYVVETMTRERERELLRRWHHRG